jgi:two-component system cell cycle sensor histidine kinase/response regulator CckA
VCSDEATGPVRPGERFLYLQKPAHAEAIGPLATALADNWAMSGAVRRAQAELTAVREQVGCEVAARSEAEQALRGSEAVLASVLRAAPAGVGVVHDHVLRWENGRLCEMTGYTSAELVGHSMARLYESDEECERAWRAMTAEGVEQGAASIETRWVTRDGAIIDVLLRCSHVDGDGPSAGVAFTATDITRRNRAEQALHESENTARALLDASPDMAFLLDSAGAIVTANGNAVQAVGKKLDEFIGVPVWDVACPQVTGKLGGILQEVVASGEAAMLEGERDGRYYVHRIHPVLGASGEVVRLSLFSRDITDRWQSEEELRQASRLESIGTLAGGVAHDFNNILTGIIGYAEILKTEGAIAAEYSRDVDKIQHLANRAAGLTRQLLLFSRQQPIEPTIVSLNDLVGNLSKMLRRIIEEDIELRLVLDPDLGMVRADAGQIEQVLMNLAVNARDAMPQGGSLAIETTNLTLEEECVSHGVRLAPGHYAVIAVSDSGCGMDRATRERIFEPFFTTKEVGKGTGLGLATVYGIVQQHEGSIWVYSELERGTTFKVYLPVVDERRREASPVDEAAVKGSETILLAEDEETVRDVVQQGLEKQGYTVLCAANPEEAKAVFEQYTGEIALLLTDVVMPGKTGPGLYEWLMAKQPSLKALFMSGYTEHAAVSTDLFGGETPFLQKPFTPTILARKVREVLDR